MVELILEVIINCKFLGKKKTNDIPLSLICNVIHIENRVIFITKVIVIFCFCINFTVLRGRSPWQFKVRSKSKENLTIIYKINCNFVTMIIYHYLV
jgi:hypothetical protein